MESKAAPSPVKPGHIRRIDVTRDLTQVADLIELCFASTLDEDGHEYLRRLRRIAREASAGSWVGGIGQPALQGLVWEEEGRILGNVTLFPMRSAARRVYLIANVAVHPELRRRGIGKILTEAAVEAAYHYGAKSVMLQVREDNTGAHRLYQELGFQEITRRTTWQSTDSPLPNQPSSILLQVGQRSRKDWPQHKAWLEQTYPADVDWFLSLRISALRPHLRALILDALGFAPFRFWAAREGSQLRGVAAWQAGSGGSDAVWLAVDATYEDLVIEKLLRTMRRQLPGRRKLSVNYPALRGAAGFRAAGFSPLFTLIWMVYPERAPKPVDLRIQNDDGSH